MMINDVDLISSTGVSKTSNHNDIKQQRSVEFADTPQYVDEQSSVDEVDFVPTPMHRTLVNANSNATLMNGNGSPVDLIKSNPSNCTWNDQLKSILKTDGERKSDTLESDGGKSGESKLSPQLNHHNSGHAKHSITSTIERKLPKFPFQRKRSDPTNQQTVAGKERPKFVKCASIARLFGNTYSTQKSLTAKEESSTANKDAEAKPVSRVVGNGTSYKIERFRKCPESHVENGELDKVPTSGEQVKSVCDDKDKGAKTFRSISKSLGRLWRRSRSVEISIPDPEYKVLYLGNVLTGWAKGDSCIEKPLATLWRNYTQNNKPDVVMRIVVCSSGLKATTRQHGLTEYWSNRITHCSSPKGYPRIFCWIYRHEGRKLKHELRCHAVLCPKESVSEQICQTLKENLSRALLEFKRDKINRQNARLSLVNSVYDNPSMPRRKILLSVGANNYRPPMERSKSAPKLMSIEEAVGEEDEETVEHTEESRRSCCKVDPLFPAMTLGRRHCRRGHSMRRSRLQAISSALKIANTVPSERERSRSVSFDDYSNTVIMDNATNIRTFSEPENECKEVIERRKSNDTIQRAEPQKRSSKTKQMTEFIDDEDDEEFNSLLMINKYDPDDSLSGELMSYFDTKIKMKAATSLCDLSPLQYNNEVCMATNTALLGQRASISLDDLDILTDEYENQCDRYNHRCDNKNDDDDDDDDDDDKDAFFSQDSILDCLVNATEVPRGENRSISESTKTDNDFNENDYFDERTIRLRNSFTKNSGSSCALKRPFAIPGPDSDEGSISSGCETASNMTANNGDASEKETEQMVQDGSLLTLFAQKNGRPATILRVDSQSKNQLILDCVDEDTNDSIIDGKIDGNANANGNSVVKSNGNNDDDCDSEFSDESGFVEYQHNIRNGIIISDATEAKLRKINDNNNNTNVVTNDFVAGDKVPARLMINIPKNAKSILI